ASGETSETVSITEVRGSHTITFTADSATTISDITFGKVDEQYHALNAYDIPLNDYEYAVLTSVILKDDATVIKSRGAIQNLNIDDIRLTPVNTDGKLYVPFKKFAEALGYYAEDYPDKAYIYMAGETESLVLSGGMGYYESDKNGRSDLKLDVTYFDGETWVPVRALAEALGFYVAYRDGYVVIDDRLSAKKVIEDEEIFAKLCEDLSDYIIKEETPDTKTYHVDQNSLSNSSLGTEEAPFKTLSEAAAVAEAGDMVIVHAGTYREELKPKNSGTSFAPITFCAAKGEDVVISALEPLSGFTSYSDKIYSASVSNDLGFGRNQLFYKGEALVEGRHPNQDTKVGVVPYPENISPFYATRGNMRITEYAGNVVESTTDLNQQEADYWKGATYVTLKGEGWSLVSGEVTASSPGQFAVKDHEGTKSYNLGLTISPRHNAYLYRLVHDSDYGYLTNHINTLDVAGEWYMQDNVLYLIPPDGANLSTDFEIKQRQRVIDLRGKQYITIKDINTIGGGVTMSGEETRGCVLNGGTHKYIAHHTILLDQSRYAMTQSESLSSQQSLKAGEAGFILGGQNNAIVNATIDHSSATGITLLGKYHYVNNNVISNTSYSGGYPGGIYVTPDISKGLDLDTTVFGGHFITRNTVFNSGRSVILLGSTYNGKAYAVSPLEIAYNRFFNGALTSRDTGITYEYGFTGGNDKAKTRMHHNFVYNAGYKDKDTGNMLYGLYQDGQVAARDTYCNVAYYEEKDKAFEEGIFEQSTAYTVLRCRNNAELGYLENGEFDIEWTDFPGQRPFLPGSDHGALARRYTVNYENIENGVMSNVPTDCIVDGQNKTFVFENIHIEGDGKTLLTVDFGRKANKEELFNITARVYTNEGVLVGETTKLNEVENTRFYVNDTYKGIVVIPQIEEGDYKVEIEFPDLYTEAYRLKTEVLDGTYDDLYTPEMEAEGIIPYYPEKSDGTVSGESETFTFNGVYIESGKNMLLSLHMTR
ncbi:MAG: hypothetical protein IKB72_04930, partial [Ruminococcus sp.]|nr:hypothetical protein [Ruminococcus sp.]